MECWYGFLVSVLSVLVMILIGWQIYTAVNIRKEVKYIRKEVDAVIRSISKESNRLSTAVYSTIFEEKIKKNDDVYGYFKYGLLVILHAEKYGNIPVCLSVIQGLKESFPVTKSIRNQEKADILSIASRISETSLNEAFCDLHGMIITKIQSSD